MCRGKVLLQLSDVILLDRCQVMVRQPMLERYLCRVETVSYLQEEAYGVKNSIAVETLLAMAREADIPTPTETDFQETLQSNDMSLEETTDSSLRLRTECLTDEETLNVYMTECYSPDCFYVALVGKMKNLDNLEYEIRERIIKEDPTCYMNAKVGDFVVFHDFDGTFKRGQVKEVIRSYVEQGNELGFKTLFRVWHLDSGIVSDVVAFNIYKCWPEILVGLPFQAVECKLSYVAPILNKWDDKAGDRLFEKTRSGTDDNALMLQCNVVNRCSDGVYQVQLRAGLTSLDQV